MIPKIHFSRFVLAFFLGILTILSSLHGNDRPKGADSSITVDQALLWLPANTETLIVSQGPFELKPAEPADQKVGQPQPLDKALQLLPCGLATQQESNSLKSLKGLTVDFVLEGARGFRSPKGLGMMPYDGCHITVFKNDLKTARDSFIDALKSENPGEEQVAGQKTYVIKAKLEEDAWKFYLTIPRPNVILVATDRAYLEEVLKRMAMKEKPTDRAFPDNLPEWKHVDRKAKFWGMRHYDKLNAKNDPSTPLTTENRAANIPDPKAIGLVFEYDSAKENLITVKYLSDNEDAARIAAMGWTHETEGLEPRIQEKRKGVIQISVELKNERVKGMFFLVFLAALGHGVYI
jgi:hypothetical protein